MVCYSALALLASFALVALFSNAVVFSLVVSLIGFPWVSRSCAVCPLIWSLMLAALRVAVFLFVFPISRSAHLWAPDEVNIFFFFAKQSRRPTHFHPAQQKKTMISISDRK